MQRASCNVGIAKKARAHAEVYSVRVKTTTGAHYGPPRGTKAAAELDMQRLINKPEKEQVAELQRLKSGGGAAQNAPVSGTPRRQAEKIVPRRITGKRHASLLPSAMTPVAKRARVDAPDSISRPPVPTGRTPRAAQTPRTAGGREDRALLAGRR